MKQNKKLYEFTNANLSVFGAINGCLLAKLKLLAT